MVKELSSETFWGHAGATARWHGVPTHRDTFCIPHTLHFARVLCAGRTMPTPKPVQEPLAPGNRLPHVTKGTLPIWLRLEMGRVSGLPGWTQCNHQGPHSKWTGEAGASQWKMWQEVRVMWLLEGGHRPRNVVASGSWNSRGNRIVLVVSIKNTFQLTLWYQLSETHCRFPTS